jgi:hypothetical protein
MSARESRQTVARGGNDLWNAARGATAEAQNADRQGEHILYPMVHLSKQEFLALLRPLAITDIAGDL